MKSAAIAPAWIERHRPPGQTLISAVGSLAVESLASSDRGRPHWFAKATGPALRSALDSPGGRVLTDAECERTGSRLLELVRILREWDQKTKTLPPETGNV
jgi:hypothetical protein